MPGEEMGATPIDASATLAPHEVSGAAPATGVAPQDLAEGGKAAIAQERTARRAAESRATAAETELKKHREAQLSDIEKANKRADDADKARAEAETALRERTVHGAVIAAAAAANFVNPDLAARLIATTDVELDADGGPKNAEKLVADLGKQYPYMLRSAGSFDQGARASGAAGAPVFRASQIGDRAFYLANKDAIMLAQREGRIVMDT